MSTKDTLIQSALSALLILTTASPVIAATTPSDQSMEKCYGIAKAGMNDCAAGAQSCAGSVTKNNQADAFLFVPKGLCQKITGGTLKKKGQ